MKIRRIVSLLIVTLMIVQMMPVNIMATSEVQGQETVQETVQEEPQKEPEEEPDAEKQDEQKPSGEEPAKSEVEEPEKDPTGTDDGKEEADKVDDSDQVEDPEPEEETEPEEEDSDADFIKRKRNEAVDVQGEAAKNKVAAAKALLNDTDMAKGDINDAVDELFNGLRDGAGDQGDDSSDQDVPPRQGDGSNIEAITAKWITPDSVDNDDPSLLYRKPERLEEQKVRLQINYALSGEHKYEPGDVTITIPASIFKDRNGKDYGSIIIPYPEDPSKKSDFNWKQVGDKIILTNTKRMSAATKGYIQFEFDKMYPQMLVDMETSAPFDAYIEVTTHLGNIIALRSNQLTAQFDTEAIVTSVNKHAQSVSRVGAAQIPENQRIPGENEYIRVTWYVKGTTKANTYYTLDQLDSIPQAAVVESRKVVADDNLKDENKEISLTDAQAIDPNYKIGDTVVLQTEADVHGFVIGGDSSESISLEKDDVFHGYKDGEGSYYTFSTAYPASQFKKDIVYTFHNNIKYTVTEDDPEVSENTNPNVQDVDPQKVTEKTASAQVTWYFRDPKWINPTGHFMVHKNGNDDTEGGNKFHKSNRTNTDPHVNSRGLGDGWYGIYPSAINELQDENKAHGEDGSVRLSYTINTVGYTMPWMYDGGYAEFVEGKVPTRIIGNYNRPVTLTTTDTGVSIGRNSEKLKVFEDYTFNEIEFPNYPYVYKGRPQNINPDGSWTATDAGDGTFKYTSDSNKANWPDITLQIERNGEWEDYAVVSWKSGNRVVTLTDGTTLTDTGVVKVPEDTHNFRTIVTTKNTEGGDGATEAIQAAIDYDVRVVINLKSTEKMMELIDQAFENTKLPQMDIWNSTNMLAVRADEPVDSSNHEIVSINKDGYDSIRGYTTDTSVYPHKTATQNLREVDYENRKILIHYTGKVEIQSIIYEKKTWQEAVDEGRLVADRHGFWRDLLPKGVTPDLSTIKVRKGDTVVDAYTIEDYQGSGRTLLVVEVDLTPTPELYRAGDMSYYEDVPTITFDAIYDFESLKDYGYSIHNVISFESSNDHLGTIKNYTGEPDDPYYINPETGKNNNIATERAFKDDKEKSLMKDLNPDNDNPSYVYAGVTTNINILNAARTSLYKDIQVNNDGIWSDGTYYRDIYGPEVEATEGGRMRTVYEGGQYSYRLRVMSDPDTVSTGMVIFDSLENFHAQPDPDNPDEGDNDLIDVDAERWQGKLRAVDISQLEALGCDPIVYYSLIPELQLSDESDPDEANATNTDLNNTEVWVKASDYTGDLADVKAIAIDCRKAKENAPAKNKDSKGFFRLQPLESAVVILRMQAPSGDEARDIISRNGIWGASAQAYNNAYLLAVSLDEEEADDTDYNPEDPGFKFVRKDYTKVGMKEYSVKASKVWSDDNDRDGKRPDTLTFTLLADGEVVKDSEGNPVTRTINVAEGEKEVVFEHIPYTTPDGDKIHYTVQEEEIEGYEATESLIGESDYTFTNKHIPEKIDLAGVKTWKGDEEDITSRPEKIDVVLYANEAEYKTITVEPDSEGNWEYEFKDLFKYADGKEIEYTIEEKKTPGTGDALDSYVTEVDGMDIQNTYHPFGDLKVNKKIEGTTEVSAEQDFTFTFAFSKTTKNDQGEDEDSPVFDEFDYEILDADGEPVTGDDGEPITGKVKSNDEIKIKGGQTIHVKEVPEYVKYTVTEAEEEGFTLKGKVGDNGTVEPNETSEATFTNKYEANGQINLGAVKKLENRKLNKYQFRFELYEVVEDDGSGSDEDPSGSEVPDEPSAGTVGDDDDDDDSSDGEVIRGTASSDVVSETVLRPDGTVNYSLAPVTFGVLRYTQEDHGKTFTYRIKEVDLNRAGYEYSTDIYEVEVKVTDNGDGTLSVVPTYKDKSGNKVDAAEFVNTYTAKGDTTLDAWKNLTGRDLAEEEFEFELFDENGDTIKNADGQPVTAKNSANGTVVFDPENVDAFNYTEKDIGRTFYYGIREKAGTDTTIVYDENLYGYKVVIVDDGDGTLHAEQTLVKPVADDTGTITWVEDDAELPVFKNELKDGGFSVSKTLDLDDLDPELIPYLPINQDFTFKVTLIGDRVTDETVKEYILNDKDGGTVTKPVEMKDGEFTITLKGSERAEFKDIPAGTVYQVLEQPANPWVLEDQSGTSAVIQPETDPKAEFINTFAPDTTSVQFVGTKMLDYKTAPKDRFKFVLKETTPGLERTIETVDVLDGGFIQFKPLTYEWAWEYYNDVHTYTIEEVDPEDDTLDWDRHVEHITVTVRRDKELDVPVADVEYEDDGDSVIRFENKTRPGNLKLTKNVDPDDITDANKDDIFTFKIKFTNEDGIPLGKDDAIYWYLDGAQNTDDDDTDDDQQNDDQQNDDTQGTDQQNNAKQSVKSNIVNNGGKALKAASGSLKFNAMGDSGMSLMGSGAKAAPQIPSGTPTATRNIGTHVTVDWYGNEKTIVIRPSDGYSTGTVAGTTLTSNISSYKSTAESIIAIGDVKITGSLKDAFRAFTKVKTADLEALDVSAVTSLERTFYEMTSVTELKLSNWDVSNVSSFWVTFGYLSQLEVLDLSGWSDNKASSSSGSGFQAFIYSNVNLKVIDLSNLKIKSNTNIWAAIAGNNNLQVMIVGPEFRFTTSGYNSSNSSSNHGIFKGSGSYDSTSFLNNTRWYRAGVDDPANAISLETLRQRILENAAGTWVRVGYSADFTIQYDANGGTGNPEPVTQSITEGITLPEAEDIGIANGDMLFAGWAKDKDSVFPDYQAGDTFYGTPGTTTTLYAVWIGKDSYLIHLNGNGGFVSPQWKRANALDEEVELPTPTHPNNLYFYGWNTQADGMGETYTGTVTGNDLSAEPGDTIELYAIWLESNERIYRVQHYREMIDIDDYTLYETDRLKGAPGATVSPAEKTYEGFNIQPHESEYTIPNTGELVVRYEYKRNRYSIHFDGNGADSGQMTEAQVMKYEQTAQLFPNSYQRKGFIFTGWNTEPDGSGRSFTDKAKIKNLSTVDGDEITLYAQWFGNEDNMLEPTNGEIIVQCKAGETIVIPDLPAGTTYTIEEIDNPSGWKQEGEIEGNGETIVANVTNNASVTNKYEASGEAFLNAHKTLAGETLEEGQFTFQLLDSDKQVIETVTNGEIDGDEQIDNDDGDLVDNPYYNTSLVKFSEIDYDESDIGKTYTYYIREVIDSDDVRYQFDESLIEVKVTVTDGGHGVLLTDVSYKDPVIGQYISTEYTFKNEMSKSELEIQKLISDDSDEFEEGSDEFEFTLTLIDKDGDELEGEFDAEKGDEALTVKSGDTITLKGGEKITIKGLPHGTTYTVEEKEKEDWEQIEAEGTEGELAPGETAEASFINEYYKPPEKVYDAEGSVELSAKKEMVGGVITEEDEFTFELVDEEGEVIQTKTCDKVTTDDEKVTLSDVTFDKINYDLSQLDYPSDKIMEAENAAMEFINGKEAEYNVAKKEFDQQHKDDDPVPSFPDFDTWFSEQDGTNGLKPLEYLNAAVEDAQASNPREATFTYYVREVPGDDQDVTYDKTRYYYKVRVVDSGDGTLVTTPTMYKMGSEEDEIVGEIKFVNSRTTQVRVFKRWVDNENQDGYRPSVEEFIQKIHLMIGDIEVTEYEPIVREDEDGNLTIIYENLPAYDDEGNKITYTVKEDNIDQYTPKDEDYEVEDGETLMNIHEPEKTTVTVEKFWDDQNDLSGRREGVKATVQLYGQPEGGEKKAVSDPVEVGTEDDWTYTWENLSVKEGGKDITYTVEETMENDRYYTSSIEPMDEDHVIKITNTSLVTDLVIRKSMPVRVSGEGENSTIAFKVEGKNSAGEVIYTSTVGFAFNDESDAILEKTLKDVPIDAEITVTEVYSGNYDPEDEEITKTKIERVGDSNVWLFEFNNTPDDNQSGSGAVNKYEIKDDEVKFKDSER